MSISIYWRNQSRMKFGFPLPVTSNVSEFLSLRWNDTWREKKKFWATKDLKFYFRSLLLIRVSGTSKLTGLIFSSSCIFSMNFIYFFVPLYRILQSLIISFPNWSLLTNPHPWTPFRKVLQNCNKSANLSLGVFWVVLLQLSSRFQRYWTGPRNMFSFRSHLLLEQQCSWRKVLDKLSDTTRPSSGPCITRGICFSCIHGAVTAITPLHRRFGTSYIGSIKLFG